VPVKGIATLMRNVMFGMALLILIGYLISKQTENQNIEIIFLFIAILIGLPHLLSISNSDKYKLK